MDPEAAVAPHKPKQLRLQHVDGLRALAALVVFVNHAFAQVWTPGGGHEPAGAWSLFSCSLVAGHLSVTVFIVISGFCLALPVVTSGGERLLGGPLRFFRRRARRILPPYYGALFLSLALILTVIGEPTGSLWDVPITWTPAALVAHLLLVQDFFGTGSINYVFWSIAVEWQIYFLFPLLVGSWRKLGPGATVALALIAGYSLRLIFGDTRVARASPQFIGMFALGMLAAHVALSERELYVKARRLAWGAVALGMFVLVVFVTWSWGIETSRTRFYVLDLPVGILAMALLILTTTHTKNPLARLFGGRTLATVGGFSYSLYLIHAPLLQLLWQYGLMPRHLSREVTFSLLMTLGLALILGAAYLFYRVFEAPALRSARREKQAASAVTP